MSNLEDKGTKISIRQKEVLIKFMEDHPKFATGQVLDCEWKEKKKAMWEVLTTQLNCTRGPKKTSEKWQRVWIDLKNKTKKKLNKMTDSNKKGASYQSLTNLENRILNIIGKPAIYDLKSSQDVSVDSEDAYEEDILSSTECPQPVGHKDFKIENIDPTYDTEVTDQNLAQSSRTITHSTPKPMRRPSGNFVSAAVTVATRLEEVTATSNSLMESIERKLDQLIDINKESNEILKQLVLVMQTTNK